LALSSRQEALAKHPPNMGEPEGEPEADGSYRIPASISMQMEKKCQGRFPGNNFCCIAGKRGVQRRANP